MTKTMVAALVVFGLAAARFPCAGASEQPLSGSFTNWINHPAIAYGGSTNGDPVAALIGRLHAGQVTLTAQGEAGFLRSLLTELDVPVESQIAVFNKDSLQARRICWKRGRPAAAGSSKLQWIRSGSPGKTGQLSAARSQTVMT